MRQGRSSSVQSTSKEIGSLPCFASFSVVAKTTLLFESPSSPFPSFSHFSMSFTSLSLSFSQDNSSLFDLHPPFTSPSLSRLILNSFNASSSPSQAKPLSLISIQLQPSQCSLQLSFISNIQTHKNITFISSLYKCLDIL